MIHITLGAERPVIGEDPLGRSFYGFSYRMSDQELYDTNRGCWVLGSRAVKENYALFTYDGIVRQAVAIDRLVPAGAKKAIEGRILKPGDPVHDRYVGGTAPVPPVRNPVTYFESDLDTRLCRCGCGETTARGDFLPGHDQRAIHERIARVGTVSEFLDWFDANDPTNKEN